MTCKIKDFLRNDKGKSAYPQCHPFIFNNITEKKNNFSISLNSVSSIY